MTDTIPCLAISRKVPNRETGLERHLPLRRTVVPRSLGEYEPGTFTELAEYAAYLAFKRLEGVTRD